MQVTDWQIWKLATWIISKCRSEGRGMDNITWIFSGIGTEIVIFLLGTAIGGVSGYKIAIMKNGIQKQKAKDQAIQKQKVEIEMAENIEKGEKKNANFRQIQKAGNRAEQSQVGRIK